MDQYLKSFGIEGLFSTLLQKIYIYTEHWGVIMLCHLVSGLFLWFLSIPIAIGSIFYAEFWPNNSQYIIAMLYQYATYGLSPWLY